MRINTIKTKLAITYKIVIKLVKEHLLLFFALFFLVSILISAVLILDDKEVVSIPEEKLNTYENYVAYVGEYNGRKVMFHSKPFLDYPEGYIDSSTRVSFKEIDKPQKVLELPEDGGSRVSYEFSSDEKYIFIVSQKNSWGHSLIDKVNLETKDSAPVWPLKEDDLKAGDAYTRIMKVYFDEKSNKNYLLVRISSEYSSRIGFNSLLINANTGDSLKLPQLRYIDVYTLNNTVTYQHYLGSHNCLQGENIREDSIFVNKNPCLEVKTDSLP